MSLVTASLGIIIGTLIFVLTGAKLFVPALIIMSLSTAAFTSYKQYHRPIILGLFCILLSYFNYHLRADWLELQDYTKLLNSGHYQLEIISKPRSNPYFESEFIVELKAKHGFELRSLILPYRLSARTSMSKGLELGDIIELDKRKDPKSIWQTAELSEHQAKILRKDKVFRTIKNKNLSYLSHKQSTVTALQTWIRHNYESQLSYENSQIVTSLILGSRVAKLPDQFSNQIRNLGLTHIFAASGFNLLIISATLTWIFNLLKVSRVISCSAIIAAATLYTALAGFSPSIVRSLIFVTVFILLKLSGRKPLSSRFLVILAGLILALDPYAIFDIGFQLSYLATLALILFASPIQKRLGPYMAGIPAYFQEIISTGIAVQLILMPLIIYYFHSAQIWALMANIVFTPFVTLIIILAVLGLGFVVEPLMNLFKFMLKLSEHLPFIETRLELDFISYLLLSILFAYIAFLIGRNDESDNNIILKIKNKYLSAAIISSIILFLLAGNAPAMQVEAISLYHGKFKGKYSEDINSFISSKEGPCYKYTKLAGLKTLIIKNKRNISCMQELDGRIEEVQLLILPNLSAGDLYLDTLIDLSRPQFVIANIAKDSHRARFNAETLNSSANTILNSGKLYVSRNKFWSIASYE